MSLPVLTAVADAEVEAHLVTALRSRGSEVHVVRRCVDLADLLAAAGAGLGRAVLLSAQLRRLDREALTRLAVAGVGVVGVVAPDDAEGESRLCRLGVTHLVRSDSGPGDLVAALVTSVGAATSAPDISVPTQPLAPYPGEAQPADTAVRGRGRVVAVWGPVGAPGRSTLAVNLAAELAGLGESALLVDADAYGGTSAQLLGLLDEVAGLAGACRLANNGTLDLSGLAELALEVRPRLRVLTGIARADRWPELRPSALEVVLDLVRDLATTTVVDCGFCLERDEELSFDTVAPRRNGATLTAIAEADTVVAVGTGDPVGLQRLVRGLGALAEAAPDARPITVVNRVRPAAVGGGDPRSEIRAALDRFAGIRDVQFVPLDMAGYDAALAAGRTLLESAPTSPARQAIQQLAADLLGLDPPPPRGRLFRRTRRPART